MSELLSIVLVGTTVAFLANLARYWFQRQSGYTYFFAILLIGWLLFQLSAVILGTALKWSIPNGNATQLLSGHPVLGTTAGIFLAILISLLANCFCDSRRAAVVVAEYSGDLIECLLQQSLREYPVELTLESRKSYVGLVVNSGVATFGESDIELVPLFSGYRNDSGELKLTTAYDGVINRVQSDVQGHTYRDFRVCIPKNRIVSARPFFPNVFFQEFGGGHAALH